MTLALSLFVLFYILMLAVQQYRPWVALGGAGAFLLLGKLGVYDFTLADAARAVDFNVLLMMAGMMGTVFLFIQSKMPARLAEELIAHVPDVRWAVSVLALLAGFISAFVDNVATVLMVAPVGLAIARRLKLSPVPVLIAIAVSSNLQGAATLVGDTTSILLGGFAGMNFFDFFWMEGRPGIFWSVELGAMASLGVLFWLFRDQRQPVHVTVETEVEDDVPTALLLLTVGLLIAASFLPEPSGGVLHLLYTLRSGLVCMGLCLFGAARACWRSRSLKPLAETFRALDYDTLLLLFSLFILLEGVSRAGVIDAAAQLFHSAAGDEPLHLYLLLVAASVGLSAFIDNIPYVAAMRDAGRQPDPHRRVGQHRGHRHSPQERRDCPHPGLPAHRCAVHVGSGPRGGGEPLAVLGHLRKFRKNCKIRSVVWQASAPAVGITGADVCVFARRDAR